MGRVHINSCDFSMNSYSFDDKEDDWNLSAFDMNLARDSSTLIPFILEAQRKLKTRNQSLKLLASPWSPPWWMKTNKDMIGSPGPGLRPECQGVWARYLGKWIKAMKQKGIPIWGITIQNEPLNNNPFESCMMPAEGQAEFLAWHLGPTLKNWHPDVKIFAFDHNKGQLFAYTNGVVYGAGGQAAQYLDGVAWHWYEGDLFGTVQMTKQNFPNLMLLSSEATYEKWHFRNGKTPTWDWRHGTGYAHAILGDLKAGSSGWIDWNLVLDVRGGPNHVGNTCDAAMIADIGKHRVKYHPQYYYIGHFSKWFWPGSHILTTWVEGSWKNNATWRPYGVCDGTDGLEATSVMKTDGKIAVVVLNCGFHWLDFRIRVDNGTRTMKGKVPPHGIQTYLLPKIHWPSHQLR